MHMHMHMHMHTHMHTHMHAHMHTHTHTCMHTQDTRHISKLQIRGAEVGRRGWGGGEEG